MKRYATKAQLGHEPTAEDVARIHNGGPDGWKKTPRVLKPEKAKKMTDAQIKEYYKKEAIRLEKLEKYWGLVSKELYKQGADKDMVNGTATISF